MNNGDELFVRPWTIILANYESVVQIKETFLQIFKFDLSKVKVFAIGNREGPTPFLIIEVGKTMDDFCRAKELDIFFKSMNCSKETYFSMEYRAHVLYGWMARAADYEDWNNEFGRYLREHGHVQAVSQQEANDEKKSQKRTISSDIDTGDSKKAKTDDQSTLTSTMKLVNQKEGVVASKVSETGPRHEEDLELENKEAENVLPRNQEIDTVEPVHHDAPIDQETLRLEEAATKAQADFRGYLARRAFRAKAIIRLQALIRGHLVRRQAVVTLYCMYGIVKLQALGRGQSVRKSDVGFEVHEKCILLKFQDDKPGKPITLSGKIMKLSANTFIRKLIASSTTIMALRLQYVPGDPNSFLSWLERWSASWFWKPIPQPKKIRDTKPQKKQGNISTGDAQTSKSKRTHRKLANLDLAPSQANPEIEKPKRNVRKFSSQPSDPVVENPQIELEKVKRNLRKVHNPVVETAILSEVESETLKPKNPQIELEKVKRNLRKVHNPVVETAILSEVESETLKPNVEKVTVASSSVDVSEPSVISSNGKIKKEATLTISRELDIGIAQGDLITKQVFDTPNGGLSHKEDQTGSENQKPTRKASIVAKQERAENGLHNSPTIPSYMAATESAKAKLRAQGSPKVGQDGSEKNNNARRQSLSSSTNSKISSHSPKIQRPIQSGGKVGHKSDKAVSSSKELYRCV